jgi:hypothetical protein
VQKIGLMRPIGSTADYFNLCGITSWGDPMIPPDFPLPDGGARAMVGFYEAGVTLHEMIGACLDGPMLAGVTYILKFFYGKWGDSPI